MKEKNINTTIKVCEKCGEPLEQLFPNGPILGMDRHPRMCSCMRIVLFFKLNDTAFFRLNEATVA